MRILIPQGGTHDNFQDNVAQTLRAMGHEVLMPERLLDHSRWSRFRALAFPRQWTEGERWLAANAGKLRPDLVLVVTQLIRSEVLEALRAQGIPRIVAWWGDAPANLTRMGLLSDHWDVVFLKDADAVRKFRAVGIPAELLHEAMNPVWHDRRFERIGDEIVVAGNYYGYRQFLVERLIAAGQPMALYGFAPPRWAMGAIRDAYRGRVVLGEEKSRVFGEGIACLNSTALCEGNSLNCRAFEVAGACGLQLIEDKPAVSSCFEPGKEVLTYRSVEEILELVRRAKKEPEWAMKIREAGHARAHAHHTYEQRLRTILDHVD